MELGGKNSSIVCADADLTTAVQGVLASAFLNVSKDDSRYSIHLTKDPLKSGQICMATDRILVHSSIAHVFTEALKTALASGTDTSSLPPTLVNTASRARVEAVMASAVASGEHFISGSAETNVPADAGVRLTPAILVGVKEDMAVWQEEAVASVAACMVFETEDEAIRLANSSVL